MTEYIISAGRAGFSSIALRAPQINWRIVVFAALALLAVSSGELRTIVFSSIADAYLQVTVFVAGTLAIVYAFENAFQFDLGQAMARARALQVPIAAGLGALPGCGGAIIVVTQYTRGHVSFGGVVAVLIATMGDAAFLLLAREPLTGLGIMVMGFVVGTLSGWAVDGLHGTKFMRVKSGAGSCPPFAAGKENAASLIVVTQYTRGHVSFGGVVAVLIATMGDAAFLLLAREPLTGLGIMVMGFVVGTLSGWAVDGLHGTKFMRVKSGAGSCPPFAAGKENAGNEDPVEKHLGKFWIALAIPGVLLGLLVAFQLETDKLFGPLAGYEPTHIFGVAGAILCLVMWAFGRPTTPLDNACPYEQSKTSNTTRVIRDTNFVTSWVVLGFLSYELAVHFTGAGIENWLKVWAPFVPLVAILVGFIPGCGPQIVVTSLYLAGAVPLSAQIANAISNDGDALFPALALAPKAAIYATLYSAIPALIIGYGYYALAESVLAVSLFAR